ncbi:uracil-DNA glycosylase [Parvularcula lutaonensis]|uniref:Type-5 uracil-DNA glycosylase n=1 Tax=Parvularcula lutaonensis TaxID=491923 RepID=A0ABV7MCZ9_9PROT|nr:uracil-DNA glycosylase [Parvularcula lutaonensis]GGY51356.1 uracil-DNA glycosylase [Parvularcula lutaonensis]
MTAAPPPEAPQDCPLCPRLVEYRLENARLEPDWFNGAVPSFAPEGGEEAVRLLIIGLAPGRTGANRTGRPFTGDWAGDLLYDSLCRFGLAEGCYDKRPDDGLSLKRTMITNAVRCVPPENKPVGKEVNNCRPFLRSRIDNLPNLRTILCLGKISHDSTLRTLGQRVAAMPFGHDTAYEIEGPNGPLLLRSSYHCSRYNTSTGRLTQEMFDDVIAKCAEDIR